MILTLTTPTRAYARAMSGALWSLAVPNPTGTTRYAVGWITHPNTGDVALLIPEAYTQRVALDADVPAFVSALNLPTDEAAALTSTLKGAKGGAPLTVAEWLPPTLAARTLTDEEADAAGWFAEPEE